MSLADAKQSMALQVEPSISLFEITIEPNTSNELKLHICPEGTFFWTYLPVSNAHKIEWQFLDCSLDNLDTSVSSQNPRPKFQVTNVGGVFSLFISNQKLDNALITKYEVLRSHIDANIQAVYTSHQWRFGRILGMNKNVISFELRDFLDGHNFMLPARMYTPPEFGHVSIDG